MKPLRIVLILVLGAAVTTAGASEKPRKAAPLFSSNEVLEVTIRAPFSTIMRERSSDEDLPATLTYTDASEGEVTVELGIRTRGRFRRQHKVCGFAPLRLNFKKSAVKETVFAKSDKLKLVTHCNSNKLYARALVREFLAYRVFNLVTDHSFRVRPLNVRYVDTDGKKKDVESFAFIIEHREQLGKRIGLKPNESMTTEIKLLDGAHTNLGSVFQFFIANTDFSPIRAAPGEPCCHNNMLFGDTDGEILVIPYDFDMSGLVNAPHSAPNPRFKLRSVTDRLYRGRCANNEHIETSAQAFIDKKSEIYALFAAQPELGKTLRQTNRFLDKFFKTIEDPKKRAKELTDKCL